MLNNFYIILAKFSDNPFTVNFSNCTPRQTTKRPLVYCALGGYKMGKSTENCLNFGNQQQ